MSDHAIELSVSAISASPSSFFSTLESLPSESVSRIHVDVMDGVFVPRLGMYPEFVSDIRSVTSLPIDVHMMMVDPCPYFKVFTEAGASRLVPHLEPLHHARRTVDLICELNVEAGLALNPHTDFRSLRYIMTDLHAVTLMAINPGIVGHRFIPNSLEKLQELRAFLDEHDSEIAIEVDGGITFDNIAPVAAAGADVLVVGAGTIFNPGDTVASNIERLDEIGRLLGLGAT